jgi:hypothetical protein
VFLKFQFKSNLLTKTDRIFMDFNVFIYLDVDECTENTNICQYMCENQVGSYRCHCPIGFKMNTSGQCHG